MEGLIQVSNESGLRQKKKKRKKQLLAKQYFDLLVFIICILYVVTVTLTNVTNLQTDSSLEGNNLIRVYSAALSLFTFSMFYFVL